MDVIAGDIKTYDGRDPPDLVKVWEQNPPPRGKYKDRIIIDPVDCLVYIEKIVIFSPFCRNEVRTCLIFT